VKIVWVPRAPSDPVDHPDTVVLVA